MITISQVIKYLETLYPKHLAADQDPIGLQVGNVNQLLTKALITLDITEAVIKEAISLGANLVVSHHPFIYRPLATINTNTPKGKVINLCLKHDLTLYAMHTNYDIAPQGMNDQLAQLLNLEQVKPLIPTKRDSYSKIAIYVPATHMEAVRHAMGTAGVGTIGHYSHCTFATQGIGSFKPHAGSQPYLGTPGQLELVEEVKLEGVVQSDHLSNVIAAVKLVHPYEEVAYDFQTLNVPTLGIQHGLGRLGQLEHPITCQDLIELIKKAFNLTHVRFVGDLSKKVKQVAIIGGSGGSSIAAVKAKGADLFITGDVGYHEASDALDLGLNVLDVGHHVEAIMKEHVATILNEALGEIAVASTINTEPFQFI